MYCSSCGAAVEQGLSYCNRCGAKQHRTVLGWHLKPRDADTQDENTVAKGTLPQESLVWAIVSVFVVGLGATIGLIAVMKDVLNFNPGLVLGFSLLSFLLMFVVEGVFIWLLLGRKTRTQEMSPRLSPEHATYDLEAPRARVLSEPPTSITEHTTRNFEPTQHERRSD